MNIHLTRPIFTTTILAACTAMAFVGPFQPRSASASASAFFEEPTADSVMADSVKALGGEEAIKKIKTMHAELGMSANGMEITMELSWARTGGRFMKAHSPMGEMLAGTDGTTTWRITPMGAEVITNKDEVRQLGEQAAMFMNTLEPQRATKESMKSITLAGTKTFNGAECTVLHYVNNDGQEGDFYFDASTHLPMGTEAAEDPKKPEDKTTMVMSDWKDDAGVKFFRTITFTSTRQPGMPMTMNVTKIELNTLGDDTFAVPEKVKALASKPAAGDHPAASHPATSQPAASRPAGSQPDAAAASAAEIKLEDLNPDQQQQVKDMLDRVRGQGDLDTEKRMVTMLEPMLSNMPADKRLTMQYIVQELKKDIAKAGG